MNNILKYVMFVWLFGVFCFAILMPIPAIGTMGEKSRILFFHVPMSWVASVAFIMALVYGIMYIRKKDVIYDYKAASSAALGLLFSVLATATGAVWAKFEWGAFWNWDPRQTAIFVLILIYGAYFALRSAIESEETRARLSSVYIILAGITMPFFMFILPRIVDSLHPDPIVNASGKIKMDGNMQIVFFSSLAGFTVFYFWMLDLRVRIFKLKLKDNNL
jgi:heme exporter protein C